MLEGQHVQARLAIPSTLINLLIVTGKMLRTTMRSFTSFWSVAVVLLICLSSLQSVEAATLKGLVGTNHILQDFFYAGPISKVVAHSVNTTRSYETFIKKDGSFLLDLPDPIRQDVPAEEEGSPAVRAASDVYLLKFNVRALQFDQYRIDVRPAKKAGQPPVIAIRPHNPLLPLSSATYLSDPLPSPFIVTPKQVFSYFHSIQDFNALNYLWMTLKSPVILMSLGAWAMVSLMPKLMASLDPEEQAQMARNQAQMADKMAALQSGDWKGMMQDAQASPSERIPAGQSGGKKKK
ncbi:unnamed protein product [Sympodiomycopsis kandeliae]